MKHQMDLRLRWKFETIGNMSYAFSDLEGPKKSLGQLWVALPRNRCLSARSQFHVYPLAHVEGYILAFCICILRHYLLGLLQPLLEL